VDVVELVEQQECGVMPCASIGAQRCIDRARIVQ